MEAATDWHSVNAGERIGGWMRFSFLTPVSKVQVQHAA
jgi:hypothetical protein